MICLVDFCVILLATFMLYSFLHVLSCFQSFSPGSWSGRVVSTNLCRIQRGTYLSYLVEKETGEAKTRLNQQLRSPQMLVVLFFFPKVSNGSDGWLFKSTFFDESKDSKADLSVAALQWWDDANTARVLGVCFENEMPMRDFDPVGCIGEWAGLRVWLSSL